VRIVNGLPRVKFGKGGRGGWWNNDIEQISKHLGLFRSRRRLDGRESWRLARGVYQNTILNLRYHHITTRMEKAHDKTIFSMVRNLEEWRTIPYLMDNDGNRVSSHQGMSDIVAEQLKSD